VIVAYGLHKNAHGVDAIRAIRDVQGCSLVEAKAIKDALDTGTKRELHMHPDTRLWSKVLLEDESEARRYLADHGLLVEGKDPADAYTLLCNHQRDLGERMVESLDGKVTWE
jgi:hypothetical protein